jgi:hypothetical protein
MLVKVFQGPFDYKKWIDNLKQPIEIINLTPSNGLLILTYKVPS